MPSNNAPFSTLRPRWSPGFSRLTPLESPHAYTPTNATTNSQDLTKRHRPSYRTIPLLLLTFFAWLGLAVSHSVRAQGLVSTVRELPRIETGTLISAENAHAHWNRIVLLATPRISSGDVDSLPTAIRDSVSDFVLTIMASVEEFSDPDTAEPRFRLVDVGLGFSTDVDGELRAVSVADADKAGVNLGLFARMLLIENEKQLKTAKIITRTPTLMIIDAPAYVLRDAAHYECIMRHFIWVEPSTGRNAALVWLIDQDSAGQPVVDLSEPPRWAPAGLQEDRAIHVDGREFNMFGMPGKKAFAMESMPPGKPVAWTDEARRLAALPSYTVDSLRELSAALNAMLQAE